jgi:hypothetical protein
MPPHFVLISRFRLHTSADAAWRALADVDAWPRWWPQVLGVRSVRVRTAAATAGGSAQAARGSVADIDWRSALCYGFRLRVSTTRAERPRLIEAQLSGDFCGSGLWLLDPAPDSAAVDLTYRLEIELHRPWMRRFAWLLRPLFTWSHFRVMRAGAQGMARHLGCPLSGMSDWVGGTR